jgi:class 3 adenylate cyclase/tetratricopeptide (TPR) repeat protein
VRTGDERKLVTVLFADLVGSTAYADERDPERVRAALDRFYAAMQDEIERTGGTVEKFAGDAVMAVFGAPSALEDHAERALHAALAMQRRVRELFGEELEMRVGVNTGEVVVGSAREGGSFVTGDAVNVCDRLQKAAEAGEVLAGERTTFAAAGAFELGESRTVEAKGKSGGVAGVPVLRALRLVRPRGVSGLRRAFVGRGSELELLRATYRRAASNAEPHLVTIVGEPGVGKSRLVRELHDVLRTEHVAPVVRTGRCLAYGDGITYWPIGEIVRQHYGLREGASADEVARKLHGREILGLALGLDVALELHPLDAREGLHAAVVAFVQEVAAESPAILVIEDLHWAEPDLLDLLERLASDVRAPVVVLATARPELFDHRSIWGSGRRNATVLWLDPLPAAEASRMLEEMVAAALPDDLRQTVVERAEGNPFFLEELIGELVDRGALVQTEDGWSVQAGQPDLAIPDTVLAVLAARIDRLPPAEKTGLQAAAVVGRVFWRPSVLHLTLGEEPDFALLEERDLITARRGSVLADDGEFAFKHALTREVAYGSIPKARRGRLHAALADWLESGIGLDERAPLLAYHYSQAANPEDADLVWGSEHAELERVRARAVHWLTRAGQLAKRRSEFDESVELLSRAVELCDDDHERALLWREVGLAQALRYDGEAFWAAMERSLDGPLDTHERADAYSRLAFETSIRSGMWAIRPTKDRIETWVSLALALAGERSIEKTRALLARANAEPSEASEELLESITAAAEESGDADLLSFTFGARSHTTFEHLRFEESASWIERRLGLVPDIDDPDSLCEVYESAVPVVGALGRFDEARRLADEHWEIAQRLSAHHRVHAASLRLEIDDALGDWNALAGETERVSDLIAHNLATPCVRNARDLLLGALAHVCVGDEIRARELEREAASLAGEGHERELATPRLRTALVRGDAETARSLVQLPLVRTFVWGPTVFATLLDALTALREHERIEREAPPLRQPGTVVEPFALRALGAARSDDKLLAQADERFAALGLDWHRAQTQRLLAGV